MNKDSTRGFTLVELMVVVGIIGVLASVAIPQMTHHIKRARTVEVTSGLDKIANGAALYFERYHVTKTTGGSSQLPATSGGYTPTMLHTQACRQYAGVFPETARGQFRAKVWEALLFAPERNFRYRYYWYPVQTHAARRKALAYVYALGDLDCNARYSQWRLILREEEAERLKRFGPSVVAGRETD
jgi:prepilin-type N-terminal cleavage/methylation domain-containing protein